MMLLAEHLSELVPGEQSICRARLLPKAEVDASPAAPEVEDLVRTSAAALCSFIWHLYPTTMRYDSAAQTSLDVDILAAQHRPACMQVSTVLHLK